MRFYLTDNIAMPDYFPSIENHEENVQEVDSEDDYIAEDDETSYSKHIFSLVKLFCVF